MLESDPLSSAPEQNLTEKVVRGGTWIYGQMLFTNVINLGVMAILARQLTPSEFGLVALANVLLRFFVIMGTEGINQFVIYDNQDGREERVHAAFWLDITTTTGSVIISILLLVPFFAGFYAEPELGPVLMVLLVRFWFDTFSKVPDALVNKSLDFQKLVVRNTILEVMSSIASVILALTGWGVWSLVLPGLLTSPLRALVAFRLAKWRPQFRFQIKSWPRIFGYAANVTGTSLTTLILNEGDTLLIGKIMGSEILGIYNLAWQTANVVSRTVVGLTNKMALPALAAVSNDLPRLRSAVYRMLRLLSIVTFPLLIGLFVVADDFILTLYGPQWQGAILPLRIMLIYAMRYAVGSPAGIVYKAVGRPDIGLKLGLVMVPFYALSIWYGSFYGIVGVALGVTIVRTFFGFIGFELLARCLKEGIWNVLQPMSSAFIAACIMGLSVYVVSVFFDSFVGTSLILSLFIQTVVGGLVYLALLRTRYQVLARELASIMIPITGRFQGFVGKILGVH